MTTWHAALAAGVSLLAATAASAGPHPTAAASAAPAEPLLSLAHHKPGHKGGPPWARRNPDRRDWRDDRPYDRGPAYTTVCRTEYRTRFDPYAGVYLRRPVRVCREGYDDDD